MGGSMKEVSILKNCYILADPKGRLNSYLMVGEGYNARWDELLADISRRRGGGVSLAQARGWQQLGNVMAVATAAAWRW
jgi:hypothetical protein